MMKNRIIIHTLGYLSLFIFLLSGCSDQLDPNGEYPGEGAILNLTASFGMSTRLAELTQPEDINDPKDKGYQHIGLYVYYKEHYDRDYLNEPYIKNMRCEVTSTGKIIPLGATGKDRDIYIYDNMTIVAFYPYNPSPGDINLKADENNYLITEEDYSDQYFIPYRGIAEGVNPTNAYSATINLHPKHTFKVEVVLISDNDSDLPNDPDDPDKIKIFPDLDPADNTDLTTDCRRAAWVDFHEVYIQKGGGSNMGKYVAYIWQKDNDLKKEHGVEANTLLFESDGLSLYTSEKIDFKEGQVYRYGYNLTTGEVFIPTSSRIVYDAATLQAASCFESSAYQACDIDLSGTPDWQPLTLVNGKFDGGGHRITGLKINSDLSEAGLFSSIKGNSYLQNVNLVKPEITIKDRATESCYVGALCARVNSPVSASELKKLITGWPEELSEVVQEALLEEIRGSLANSTSTITACRVEEPVIVLENVSSPYVGAVAGTIGETDTYGFYNATVWDTYVLGGKISVNESHMQHNAQTNTEVGSFCGLNKGTITRCYTTTTDIKFGYMVYDVPQNPYFKSKHHPFSAIADTGTVNDCYCNDEGDDPLNGDRFKSNWPGGSWIKYTGKWPVLTIGWNSPASYSFWWHTGSRGFAFPQLLWEKL